MLREGSPPPTCHMSCFMCHMSHVMCHMLHVTSYFFGHSGEASKWRFSYQWGLPCLFLYTLKCLVLGDFSLSFFNFRFGCDFVAAQTARVFFGRRGANKTCTKILSRCQKFSYKADTIFIKKK